MDAIARAEPTVRTKTAQILSLFFVVATFCLWPVLGNTGAYIALLAALPAVLLALGRSELSTLLGARWIWAVLAAFALVATAFLLQPGQGSVPFIGDFVIFALAPLLCLAAVPFSHRVTVTGLSWIFLVAACLCALVGISGVLAGAERASALELSPIHFAVLALVVGFMALAGTLDSTSGWSRLFYLGPLFGVMAAVASSTRASLIVAVVLSLLFAIFMLRSRRGSSTLRVGLLAGVLVVTASGFLLAHWMGFTRPLSAIEPVWAVLQGDMPEDASSIYRLEMYGAALAAYADAPILGHGWHNQLSAALPHMSEVGRAGYAAEKWSYIHNDLLSLAVSAGLMGIIAFFLIIAAPVLAAVDADRGLKLSPRLYLALTLSLGMLVGGLTDVLFMVEVPKLLLVVGSGLVFSTGVTKGKVGRDRQASHRPLLR